MECYETGHYYIKVFWYSLKIKKVYELIFLQKYLPMNNAIDNNAILLYQSAYFLPF